MKIPFVRRSRPATEEILYKTQEPEIHINRITDSFFVLESGYGMGANAGLVVGPDGLLLIDTMMERAHKSLVTAIKQISDKKVEFIINTHEHLDHCGGNSRLQKAGAKVIAHRNTLYSTTLSPEITFDDTHRLEFADSPIDIKYAGGHHSHSDCIIHLPRANVVMMGDLLPGLIFPGVGVAAGINDFIASLDYAIALSDGSTRYVPAEGEPVDVGYVKHYKSIWLQLIGRIDDLFKSGLAAKEIAQDEELFRICKLFPSRLNWNQLDALVRLQFVPTLLLNWELSSRKESSRYDLEPYVGSYQFPDFILEIVKTEYQLYAQILNKTRRKIFPSSESVFKCFAPDTMKLEFKKLESATTANLVVATYQNRSMTGNRLEQISA